MNNLTKGGNATVPTGPVTIDVTAPGADVSAYLLGPDGRVRSDDDMIFFNQPSTRDSSIRLEGARFDIDLGRVDAGIERIAICAVPESGNVGAMGRIGVTMRGEASYLEDATGMTEAAIILCELYRRSGGWKIRAVAQGFNGGLGPLSTHFGVDVEETPQAAAVPAPPPVSLSKVDLRKHKVGVSLAKHGISGERAQVLFVIDASGSMAGLYADGTVQETVERIVPVALRLDDDGTMDTWFYASECRQVEALDETSMVGFIQRVMPRPGHSPTGKGGLFGRKNGAIGYGNNEPVVMNAILKQEPSVRTVPLLVIFLTDGGIDYGTSGVIKDILRKCSDRAVFWQYVGVGRADYGVLRDLDTIDGRVVDNAGFFAVDDLSRIDDDQLYDRLLSEFPQWLKEIRQKRILG